MGYFDTFYLILQICGRLDFNIQNIKKKTYVCQKHFEESVVDFNYWTNLNLTPVPKIIEDLSHLQQKILRKEKDQLKVFPLQNSM